MKLKQKLRARVCLRWSEMILKYNLHFVRQHHKPHTFVETLASVREMQKMFVHDLAQQNTI